MAIAKGVKRFSSNYVLYGDMSRRLYEVLQRFAPRVEPYSIDEMFLDLAGLGVDLVEHGRHYHLGPVIGLRLMEKEASFQFFAELFNGIPFDGKRTAPWKEGWMEADINMGVHGLRLAGREGCLFRDQTLAEGSIDERIGWMVSRAFIRRC